jgi:hypothetical protein
LKDVRGPRSEPAQDHAVRLVKYWTKIVWEVRLGDWGVGRGGGEGEGGKEDRTGTTNDAKGNSRSLRHHEIDIKPN